MESEDRLKLIDKETRRVEADIKRCKSERIEPLKEELKAAQSAATKDKDYIEDLRNKLSLADKDYNKLKADWYALKAERKEELAKEL